VEIYLIRHTKPLVRDGICYGATDLELPDSFSGDVKKVLQKLSDAPAKGQIYSSPLKRCTAMANLIGEGQFNTDWRLKELNFGQWEMQPWDRIYSDDLEHWLKNYTTVHCPGGESFTDVYKRVAAFLTELFSKKSQKAYVVSHKGTIQAMLAYTLRIPLKKSTSIQIDYGEIIKITQNGYNFDYEYVI
jgi:alpha-ribazole phosphatase